MEEGEVWRKVFNSCNLHSQHEVSPDLNPQNLGKREFLTTFYNMVFSHDFTCGMPGLRTPPDYHSVCCSCHQGLYLVFHTSLDFCAPLPAPGGFWSSLLCRLVHLFPAGDSVCPKHRLLWRKSGAQTLNQDFKNHVIMNHRLCTFLVLHSLYHPVSVTPAEFHVYL